MTDDGDHTQEFKPDGDRYKPSNSPETQAFSSESDDNDDTPPFGHRPAGTGPAAPPAQESGNATQSYARPAREPYQPVAPVYSRPAPPTGEGYRPAPAPAYAPPMMPTDRGSGGFPAAIIGAVVATLVAVATSYTSYQVLKDNPGLNATDLPGFIVYRLQLIPWVGLHGSDVLTAFLAGAVIVLLVTLLLMMASTLTTRAGNGGFALFLAAWMASVIAGAIARPVVSAILFRDMRRSAGAWQADITNGVTWGVLFGWIAAVVLLVVHAARRKPVG